VKKTGSENADSNIDGIDRNLEALKRWKEVTDALVRLQYVSLNTFHPA